MSEDEPSSQNPSSPDPSFPDPWSLSFSKTQRTILLIYFIPILIICILGNTIILLGSLKKAVIKTDKVTLVFLETLALLDMSLAVAHGLPVTVTLVCNSWVLGPVMCVVNGALSRALYISEILLTVSISCYRLWALRQPRSFRRAIKILHVRLYLVFLLVVSVLVTGVDLFRGIRFQRHLMSCSSTNVTAAGAADTHPLLALGGALLVGGPMIIIVITNIMIVVITSGSKRTLRKTYKASRHYQKTSSARPPRSTSPNTVITISLVCWLFVVSYTPAILLAGWVGAGHPPPEWLAPFAVTFLTINIAANSLVYGATNRSFRLFVLESSGMQWCIRTANKLSGQASKSSVQFIPLAKITINSHNSFYIADNTAL